MRTLALPLAALLAALPLAAHDLVLDMELAEPAVIVRASYDSGDPALDSDVEIRAPGRDSPFQNGLTDANGRFAFVPDAGGAWTVVVDDGYGHLAERTVEVDWTQKAATAPQGRDWRTVLAGLGVIFGFAGLFYWSRARSELRRVEQR